MPEPTAAVAGPTMAPGARTPVPASADGARTARCTPASAALVSAIERRLTPTPDVGIPVRGGVTLGDAYIVKSGDFEDTYFVGARIEGEGMENVGGVWTTDDPSGGGSIFAVSSGARQFSG